MAAAALLVHPPPLLLPLLRDDVVLPNRSRIRLAGRNRQGPPPRRRNVPPPRALDAASAHRCRSTPARDGYARRNNGSTSGQRSAVATDISACSVARVEGRRVRGGGGGRADAGQGAERVRSCSNTAKAGRSSAKVSGELAGAVAPSGAEVRDVGRAVPAWCRGRGLRRCGPRHSVRRGPRRRGSGEDIIGVARAGDVDGVVDADDVQNTGDSVDVDDVGDEDGDGGGGPDGESGRRRMKSRDEGPSRRGGRYTRMTASRRASKCTERYISRRMTESNGVYRTGLRHFRFLQRSIFDAYAASIFLSVFVRFLCLV